MKLKAKIHYTSSWSLFKSANQVSLLESRSNSGERMNHEYYFKLMTKINHIYFVAYYFAYSWLFLSYSGLGRYESTEACQIFTFFMIFLEAILCDLIIKFKSYDDSYLIVVVETGKFEF